jgi:hypothetical protein
MGLDQSSLLLAPLTDHRNHLMSFKQEAQR